MEVENPNLYPQGGRERPLTAQSSRPSSQSGAQTAPASIAGGRFNDDNDLWPRRRPGDFPTDLFHLRVRAPMSDEMYEILSPDALLFLEELEDRFGDRRKDLIADRRDRFDRIERGVEKFDFLTETRSIRESEWTAAPPPRDLIDRRIEITGPADKKTMQNAFTSGARAFMADLEDAMSPTWENVIGSQWNLRETVQRRSLDVRAKIPVSPALFVRPRGWHLSEKHIRFDREAMSASLADFGLFFFHNARELMAMGSGPYFYLPKLESQMEARLWRDVFVFSEDRFQLARGSIRATILIETLPAAFEMEEILYELREHAVGLNSGRWDYLFSIIKFFGANGELIFPERSDRLYAAPFMRAYARRLVATCHKRGVHAIGGMTPIIPSRKGKDSGENDAVFAQVREEKEREAADGFDGSWVAHPELVPIAAEVFTRRFALAGGQKEGQRENQKDQMAISGWELKAEDLLPQAQRGAKITDEAVNRSINLSLHYLSSWLRGWGAVKFHQTMEDLSTAEMARAELWHWVRREVIIEPSAGAAIGQSGTSGAGTAETRLTRDEFRRRVDTERARFAGQAERGRINDACTILLRLVLSEEFIPFLTPIAYEVLESAPTT